GQHIYTDADAPVLFQCFAVCNRCAHAQGIEYMQAWEYIGACIRPVQRTHHIHENIIPFKYNRPQILTVRKYRRYDQEYGHTREHECRQLIKAFYIRKKEIQKYDGNKKEPHQIRDDEILDKRDLLIQPDLDHMVMRRDVFLKPEEPWHIDQYIEKHPRVFIFSGQFCESISQLHIQCPFLITV